MKKTTFFRMWGGLGDVALSTPIFKELKKRNPEVKIVVMYSNKAFGEVLKHNPYIDRSIIVHKLNRWYYQFLERFKLIAPKNIAYGALRPSFTYKIKASQIIAQMVQLELDDTDVQLFTTEEENTYAKSILAQYVNPVIINITSVSSRNQMWPLDYWNELVKSTPTHTFIQLGVDKEAAILGAVDFRGLTSIRESIALVKYASSFVGVVSFLSHVTNAFKTPGIVFFGPSSAAVWGHDNNVNISKELPCAPCIDFLGNGACPYDKLCMRLISVSEVQSLIFKQTKCTKTLA